MLEPHDRLLLLDALRPPDDHALDFAIGTTFSLDLLALLTAPLGFTRFELQHSEGSDIADADAHILLRTIREFADKITIFCQAGRIAVPRGQRPLLSTLEDMVVEVAPKVPNRVFHPKVWALRFSAPNSPVKYRLIVLSRNLTFARSWDTVLVLDGELQDRANAIAANHPLGEFFAALPGLSIQPVSDAVQGRIDQAQRELRKVKFDCPPGIDDVAFQPLGIPGVKDRTFEHRTERMLVISPFLSAPRLDSLTERGRRHILVSRLDSLEKLNAAQLTGFTEIYSLDVDAVVDPEGAADGNSDPFNEGTGLHAKTFVADDGWNAHVWTGSANATTAAFDGNVEFLVKLTGKKGAFGVDSVLKREDGATNLRDMLQPFTPAQEAVAEDLISTALEDALDCARTEIATAGWIASVEGGAGAFDIVLRSDRSASLPESLSEVRVYPITLNPSQSAPLDHLGTAMFRGLSTEAITSFFAFMIVAELDGVRQECRFVVNARLVGAPADRKEQLLRSMLKDRRQLIKFIMLLLGDTDDELGGVGSGSAGATFGRGASSLAPDSEALLEPLLRALDRDPSRLDHVERLLRDLGVDGEAVPEGLMELFAPIMEARQKARS